MMMEDGYAEGDDPCPYCPMIAVVDASLRTPT